MKKNSEQGSLLLNIAILLVLTGITVAALINLHEIYLEKRRMEITSNNMRFIQNSIQNYVNTHGRLPCAAPIAAGLDTPSFGKALNADCDVLAPAVFNGVPPASQNRQSQAVQVLGRDNNPVIIGAVPTRTLNIPDSMMFDGYGHRLVYAVSEHLTKDGIDYNDEEGSIYIDDINGNSISGSSGFAKYLLLSNNGEPQGSYDKEGNEVLPCPTGNLLSRNCSFEDANFIDTVLDSEKHAVVDAHGTVIDSYTMKSKIEFRDLKQCLSVGSKLDVFFISDTTGSMGPHIAKVRDRANQILNEIDNMANVKGIDAAYGVAFYNDDPSEGCAPIGSQTGVIQPITTDKTLIQNAINTWNASGGCDYPEGNFYGLSRLISDPVSGWRDKLGRVIIIMGDAASHTRTISMNNVEKMIKDNNIAVIAMNAANTGGGIAESNQAQTLADAVKGGKLFQINSSTADEIADAIANSIDEYLQLNICPP